MRIGIAILAAVFPADINALGFIFFMLIICLVV